MSTTRIIVRTAYHDHGIEVLEALSATQHCELIATFPMRKEAHAIAYADALAAATGAQIENQMTLH